MPNFGSARGHTHPILTRRRARSPQGPSTPGRVLSPAPTASPRCAAGLPLGRPAGAPGSGERRARRAGWCRTGRAGLGGSQCCRHCQTGLGCSAGCQPWTDGSPTHGTSSLGQERHFHPGCTQRTNSRSAQPRLSPAMPAPVPPPRGRSSRHPHAYFQRGAGVALTWLPAAGARLQAPAAPSCLVLPALPDRPRCRRLRKEGLEASAGSKSPATAGRQRGTTASCCSAGTRGPAGSSSGRKMGAGAVGGCRRMLSARSPSEPQGQVPVPGQLQSPRGWGY